MVAIVGLSIMENILDQPKFDFLTHQEKQQIVADHYYWERRKQEVKDQYPEKLQEAQRLQDEAWASDDICLVVLDGDRVRETQLDHEESLNRIWRKKRERADEIEDIIARRTQPRTSLPDEASHEAEDTWEEHWNSYTTQELYDILGS